MTRTLPSLTLQESYRLERELGRGGMATVYLARDLRHDRPVVLTTLTPGDMDGGRADWALAVSQAYRFLGDSARSRAYADSAVTAYDAMLATWGDRRDRGQIVATRALSLALAGRLPQASAAADQAGALQPLGSGLQSPYVAYLRSRVDVLAGDRAAAVAQLRSMLDHPSQQSPASLAIDRTLAPLHGDPAFQALVTRASP